jgi:hypothetical protein
MRTDPAILECVGAGAYLVYLCTQPDPTWRSTVRALLCLWVIINSYPRVRGWRV